MKKKAGTIMVTSANAGSSGMLWGVPVASHTLNITIGGICKKPVKKDKSIEEREFLCLTVSVDHDIVDGAPAARFIRRFLRLIEAEFIKTENNSNLSHEIQNKTRNNRNGPRTGTQFKRKEISS